MEDNKVFIYLELVAYRAASAAKRHKEMSQEELSHELKYIDYQLDLVKHFVIGETVYDKK